jgi:hypothetical protein
VFNIAESLGQHSFSLKRVLMIIFSLSLLFLVRNYVVLAFLPAALAWVLTSKMKWQALPSFLVVFAIAGIVFFNMDRILPAANPLATIVQKQSDYFSLKQPVTAIEVDTLRPDFRSFAYNAPQAFNHILLRPYLAELPSKILLPMNIELFLYQLLFVIFLFFHKRYYRENGAALVYFAIFFTLTVFLFTGYIVPNLGSIIRYRSLYLPFLVTPILCSINWDRIRRLLKLDKKII